MKLVKDPRPEPAPLTGDEVRARIAELLGDLNLALDILEACLSTKIVSRVLPGPLEASMLHLLKQYRQKPQPEIIVPT